MDYAPPNLKTWLPACVLVIRDRLM